MRSFMKKFVLCAVVFGLMTVFVHGSPSVAQGAEKVSLTLLGAKLGSDAYNFSQALGDIVTKNNPSIRVSVLESMGSADNIKTMADLAPAEASHHLASAIDGLLSAPCAAKALLRKWGPSRIGGSSAHCIRQTHIS